MPGNYLTFNAGIGSNDAIGLLAQTAAERNNLQSSAAAGKSASDSTPTVAFFAPSLSPIVFPTDLRKQNSSGGGYPFIAFCYIDNKSVPKETIFLPLPPGIEISDSMSYSTIDLGQIGDVAAKAITSMSQQSSAVESVKSGISTAVGDIKEKFETAKGAELLKIALKYTGQESKLPVIDFGTSKILAPNTNTTFQGSNIRRYQFKFKLVAREKSESNIIRNIVNILRTNLYPEGNSVNMEFPGTWNIHFYNGGNSANAFLPKVYKCFMTDFTSGYNSTTANMWHEDGSPIEVDIAMSFQEVRALVKNDIVALNAR